MSKTITIDRKHVQMIAHRGLSSLERENTGAAFVAAGNRSYFGIETDIHRTKDGQFVVFHDDTVERLAGLDWIVEDHTMDELRTLRFKDLDGMLRGDLVMPTLQEYIRICKKYKKTSVLELKNPFAKEDIQTVVEIIRQDGWLDHTIFISFDLENMIYLRDLLPDQPLQYLAYEMNDTVAAALQQYSLDLDIWFKTLTAEQISLVHSLGRSVNVWTVDDVEDANQLVGMGIDYMTTNILE